MYGAQQMEQNGGRAARAGTNVLNAPPASDRALMEFSNWSTYVSDTPPVLMIRVTPRLVEGFWMKVARGAAMTQGAYVPSLKHFKSGSRACGHSAAARW